MKFLRFFSQSLWRKRTFLANELDEFKQHMEDLVESTHNHATGCVELTPIVPRKCSIKDAQRRSMTIDQFIDKLHTMVDDFYSAKV